MQCTYGIGGHGLLLSMSPTIRVMVTEDGELLLLRDAHEVGRITPNDKPATGEPTWLAPGMARFGEGGPILELVDGVELEAVFLHVDTGLEHAEWHAIAPGVMLDLPVGVVLLPAQPGDGDPYFELHAIGARDEFISFLPREVPAEQIVINPAPYQRLVNRGKVGDVPFTECAYEHEGKQWRQIFYAVPLTKERSLVVRAQASGSRIEHLFQAAQTAASTLLPLH